MKPSQTQIDVLRRIAAAGQPIVRRAGGFWSVADSAADTLIPRAWTRGEFFVSFSTVKALEKKGLVTRVGRAGRPADFDDPRAITALGRVVLCQEGHSPLSVWQIDRNAVAT
jgi:hypothetical protein